MIPIELPPNGKWLLSFRHEFYPPGTQLAGSGHEVKASTWATLRDAVSGSIIASEASICSRSDNFSRREGRERAMRKLMDPENYGLVINREQRRAVWQAYWDDRRRTKNFAINDRLVEAIDQIAGIFLGSAEPTPIARIDVANVLLDFADSVR